LLESIFPLILFYKICALLAHFCIENVSSVNSNNKLKSRFCVFIIILSILCLYCSRDSDMPLAKDVHNSIRNFLAQNHTCIESISDTFDSSIDILDNDTNAEVFLCGVAHGVALNEEVDLFLLEYLQKRRGVRYYIGEFSYGIGYFLNMYISTGDERILRHLFTIMQKDYSITSEQLDTWRKIRRLNDVLPRDSQLVVIGIDIPRSFDLSAWFLRTILQHVSLDSPAPPLVHELRVLFDSKDHMSQKCNQLLKNIESNLEFNAEPYRIYFGKLFIDFEMAISDFSYLFDNCNELYDFYRNTNKQKILKRFLNHREQRIATVFQKLYYLLPSGKYYGCWGGWHVYQKPQKEFISFAAILNEQESPLRGKISTTLCIYRGCKIIGKMPLEILWNKKDISDKSTIIQLFDGLCSTNIAFFDIIGKRSPFSKNAIGMDEPKGAEISPNSVQHVILIKNSESCTPLDASPYNW